MTPLTEGIAYELDMRLRPSGRSGPPAVKLSSFFDHHMKRAHSWEHIALAPARIVAGNKTLGAEVMRLKSEILARPRDQAAFKRDAYAMFNRLKSERLTETPPDIWRSKLRRGGLMEADYMRSCLHVTGLPLSPDLTGAIETWNRLQAWERLLGLKAKPLTATPQRFAEKIGMKDLQKQQSELEATVKQATDSFFDGVDINAPPEPAPIVWKN
jgi:glutamate-ammonia-ligase adenylyltransferase